MREVWLLAAMALLLPLFLAVIAAGRNSPNFRLPALALATALSIAILIILTFAFDQPSSTDLALTLALLTLPGTLIFALFEERWL